MDFEFHYRIEKYRPQALNELISHEEIISTSKYIVFLRASGTFEDTK